MRSPKSRLETTLLILRSKPAPLPSYIDVMSEIVNQAIVDREKMQGERRNELEAVLRESTMTSKLNSPHEERELLESESEDRSSDYHD